MQNLSTRKQILMPDNIDLMYMVSGFRLLISEVIEMVDLVHG